MYAQQTIPEKSLQRLYLLLGFAIALVPILYFHNEIVTEYYFSKALWANFFIPLSLILYFILSLKQGVIELPKAKTTLPVIAFCLWAMLSLLWTANPYKALELIAKVSMGPVAYFAILFLVRKEAQLRGLIALIILSMVVVAAYGFLQYFEVLYLPKDQYGEADPSTTIGLTNFVVEYMIYFICAPILLLLSEKRRAVQSLLLIAAVALFGYLIVARNRAGMLAFIVEFFVIIAFLGHLLWHKRDVFRQSRKKVMIALSILFVVGSLFLFGTTIGGRVTERFVDLVKPTNIEQSDQHSFIKEMLARASRDPSVRFRLETWYQSINNMFTDNTLVGVGLANLEVEFPRYYTPFLENMTLTNNTRVVRAHNDYVQILVDLGLIGFVLFMWIVVQLGKAMHSAYKLCQTRDDYILWLIVHVGFFGLMVECFFAFPFEVPTSAIYASVALGLSAAYRRILVRKYATFANTEKSSPQAQELLRNQLWHVVSLEQSNYRMPITGLFILLVLFMGHQTLFAYHALVAEVRNKEARVLKRYNKLDEAEALLNESIAHYPYMEGYYYDRAVIRLQKNNISQGLNDLKMTALLVPNYGMGRQQIGNLAMDIGDYTLAFTELSKTLEIYESKRAELAPEIAQAALKAGMPAKAVEVLEETLAKEITSPEIYRQLALAYSMQVNPQKTIEVYQQMKKSGNWEPMDQVLYGLAKMAVNQLNEAEMEIRSVLTTQPNLSDGWLALAKVLLEKKQTKEAIAAFEKTLVLDPSKRERIKQDQSLENYPDLQGWLKKL